MANETKDLYIEPKVTPNVVPARFTPDPTMFDAEPTQELRNAQQRVMRGFMEGMINKAQIEIQRNKRPVGSEIVHFTPAELEEHIAYAYKLEVVKTQLSERLSEFAGSASIEALEANLPTIVQRMLNDDEPVLETDDAPAEADEPEVMISPPVPMRTLEEAIDGVEDESSLELPEDDDLSLGDVLGKIAADNDAD